MITKGVEYDSAKLFGDIRRRRKDEDTHKPANQETVGRLIRNGLKRRLLWVRGVRADDDNFAEGQLDHSK